MVLSRPEKPRPRVKTRFSEPYQAEREFRGLRREVIIKTALELSLGPGWEIRTIPYEGPELGHRPDLEVISPDRLFVAEIEVSGSLLSWGTVKADGVFVLPDKLAWAEAHDPIRYIYAYHLDRYHHVLWASGQRLLALRSKARTVRLKTRHGLWETYLAYPHEVFSSSWPELIRYIRWLAGEPLNVPIRGN